MMNQEQQTAMYDQPDEELDGIDDVAVDIQPKAASTHVVLGSL